MEDYVIVSNIAKLAMTELVNSNYVDVLFFGNLLFSVIFNKEIRNFLFSIFMSTLQGDP
jgi:hypothetical protein